MSSLEIYFENLCFYGFIKIDLNVVKGFKMKLYSLHFKYVIYRSVIPLESTTIVPIWYIRISDLRVDYFFFFYSSDSIHINYNSILLCNGIGDWITLYNLQSFKSEKLNPDSGFQFI